MDEVTAGHSFPGIRGQFGVAERGARKRGSTQRHTIKGKCSGNTASLGGAVPWLRQTVEGNKEEKVRRLSRERCRTYIDCAGDLRRQAKDAKAASSGAMPETDRTIP